MAKLTIDNDLIAAEYFSDVRLLGIQCPLDPQPLIWLVNQQFGYDFRYQVNAEIKVRKNKRLFRYAIYQFEEPHLNITHFLYTNHHDGEYLLPELRHFDFMWMVKGESERDSLVPLIITELKKLEQVQIVTELAGDKIRNKLQLVL